MSETTEQRNYQLIEELRADIDFELDDVIADIVRDLPEEYFQRLKRTDQLTHLKALLAMSICDLEEEILLSSADGRQIAVIARQDYPGLLANILNRLPRDGSLVGAKIFTSKTHEFIIDLFEFDSASFNSEQDSVDNYAIHNAIDEVVRLTGQPEPVVSGFAELYPSNSRILTCPEELADHLLAFNNIAESNGIAVVNKHVPNCERVRTTVAVTCLVAREVFQRSAQYLANQSLDIEQAFLHDLHVTGQPNTAICSFVVKGGLGKTPISESSPGLAEYLRSSLDNS